MSHVVAVVVTMRRPQELASLLEALDRQARRPDAIIVIENTPDPQTARVTRAHPGVRLVTSQRNLGGAGGFAFGIFLALADGATHVWLMDDDGLPDEPSCLERLLAGIAEHEADVASPVIIDIDDPAQLAFPYPVGWRRTRDRQALKGTPPLRHFAHLFNGALVRSETFARFGVPDYRLFLRGDEVGFLHSVRRGGGLILTLTDVAFKHPSGAPETVALLGGWLHAVVPVGDFKAFHFFRNRGYLLRRYRLVGQALSDLLRYPWYYLVTRRGDWTGLKRWLSLSLRGFREDFRPYQPESAIGDAAPTQNRPKPESAPVARNLPAP